MNNGIVCLTNSLLRLGFCVLGNILPVVVKPITYRTTPVFIQFL